MTDPKTCGYCGEAFTPRANESRGQHARRKYCSPACAQLGRIRTVCPEGHALVGDNLGHHGPGGKRYCRICRRTRERTPASRRVANARKARWSDAQVRPIPEAPVREPGPAWRPAGWGPVNPWAGRRAA